jgi:hypothetical protein
MSKVISSELVKAARKAHRCDDCGERIEVGASYTRSRVVDGRDACTWRSCAACEAWMEAHLGGDWERHPGDVGGERRCDEQG